MADAYRRVEKTDDPLPPNEIRVRRNVGIGRYLKRAWDLLNGTDGNGNKNDTIIIKGVSNAVQSAVSLAELIKHRVKGLHQINKISNITIVDEYEPLYEGLDRLEFSRVVTMLQIILTTSSKVDKTDVGYQPPIPESEVQEYDESVRPEGERRPRKNKPDNRGGRRNSRRGGRRGGNRNNGDRQDGDRDNRDTRDNRDKRDGDDRKDSRRRNNSRRNDTRGGDRGEKTDRGERGERQERYRGNRDGKDADYQGERPRRYGGRGGRGGGQRGSRGGPRGGNRGGTTPQE